MVVIRSETLRQRVRDELSGTASRDAKKRQAQGRAQEIKEIYGVTP
jgi:hypothetical protein